MKYKTYKKLSKDQKEEFNFWQIDFAMTMIVFFFFVVILVGMMNMMLLMFNGYILTLIFDSDIPSAGQGMVWCISLLFPFILFVLCCGLIYWCFKIYHLYKFLKENKIIKVRKK